MRIGIEETTMAAITFASARRSIRLREQAGTALSVCREWLDAFVSSRTRQAVAEVENVRRGHAVVRNEPRDFVTWQC